MNTVRVSNSLSVQDRYALTAYPRLFSSFAGFTRRAQLDEVRLNNLVAVYANEVAPVSQVAEHIHALLNMTGQLSRVARAAPVQDELRRLS